MFLRIGIQQDINGFFLLFQRFDDLVEVRLLVGEVAGSNPVALIFRPFNYLH